MDQSRGKNEAVTTALIYYKYCRMKRRKYWVIRPRLTPAFRFDFYGLPDAFFTQYMRFTRDEMLQILPYLNLENCVWRYRNTPSPELALSILLVHLS